MGTLKATLIEGDGIGPEISRSAVRILESVTDIEWERAEVGYSVWERCGTSLPVATLDSIRRTRLALKGPITTPRVPDYRSATLALRQELDLYAQVRAFRTMPGLPGKTMDVLIVRENSEGLYVAEERETHGGGEAIRRITRHATRRIAEFTADLMRQRGRKRVTVVHKENVLRLTDGIFLEEAMDVLGRESGLVVEESILDSTCYNLVLTPDRYDVLLTTNLYGDILSDVAAGVLGTLGVVPGGNFGKDVAMFEPAHGSAPDIAGQGQANPTAMILCGAWMLRHSGRTHEARRVEEAVRETFASGIRTRDIGGQTSTGEFTDEVISRLKVS